MSQILLDGLSKNDKLKRLSFLQLLKNDKVDFAVARFARVV